MSLLNLQLEHELKIKEMALQVFENQTKMSFTQHLAIRMQPQLWLEFDVNKANQFATMSCDIFNQLMNSLKEKDISILNDIFEPQNNQIMQQIYNNVITAAILTYIGELSSKLLDNLINIMVNDIIDNHSTILTTVLELRNQHALSNLSWSSWEEWEIVHKATNSSECEAEAISKYFKEKFKQKIIDIYHDKNIIIDLNQLKTFADWCEYDDKQWQQLLLFIYYKQFKTKNSVQSIEHMLMCELFYCD